MYAYIGIIVHVEKGWQWLHEKLKADVVFFCVCNAEERDRCQCSWSCAQESQAIHA